MKTRLFHGLIQAGVYLLVSYSYLSALASVL